MTDREKLIELLEKAFEFYIDDPYCIPDAGEFADHLLANGVIVPPCKVGQTVYPLNADPRFRAIIEQISLTTKGFEFEWVQYDVGVDCTEIWDAELFDIDDIGKTVFLSETEYLIAKGAFTKEEAEAKLQKRSEDNC